MPPKQEGCLQTGLGCPQHPAIRIPRLLLLMDPSCLLLHMLLGDFLHFKSHLPSLGWTWGGGLGFHPSASDCALPCFRWESEMDECSLWDMLCASARAASSWLTSFLITLARAPPPFPQLQCIPVTAQLSSGLCTCCRHSDHPKTKTWPLTLSLKLAVAALAFWLMSGFWPLPASPAHRHSPHQPHSTHHPTPCHGLFVNVLTLPVDSLPPHLVSACSPFSRSTSGGCVRSPPGFPQPCGTSVRAGDAHVYRPLGPTPLRQTMTFTSPETWLICLRSCA